MANEKTSLISSSLSAQVDHGSFWSDSKSKDGVSYVCSDNKIKELPNATILGSLEHLECERNKISELPYYPNLKIALLRHNRIRGIPIGLKFLTCLDISNNPLGSDYILPPAGAMPCLEKLLCRSTGIRTLSTTYKKLVYLDISHNPLGSKCIIHAYPLLQTLICRNTGIKELDACYPMLETLDCEDNKISILPDKENLPNIKFINCATNNIKFIDRYSNLKTLWCSRNANISIPDDLGSLANIDCRYCKLVKSPIGKSVEYLNCSHNLITNFESSSRTLFWLDCSFNLLTNLPESLPGLHFLRAKGNKFGKNKKRLNLLKLNPRVCHIDSDVISYWNADVTALMITD